MGKNKNIKQDIKEFENLEDVANAINQNNKKVILLYGFNGIGKTRLSMSFKDLVNEEKEEKIIKHIIYYNAYTEDLFTWDNDLANDSERKIKINRNSGFINLIEKCGKEKEVIVKFNKLTNSKIEPNIDVKTGIVTFNLPTGDSKSLENIKISRGEESIFIWTMFYVFIENIIETLNEEKENRSIDDYNDIKYIYIDDPVSSLDDNHIIELAISLIKLIVSSERSGLRFIISTHHTLFYSVLFNELKNKHFDEMTKEEIKVPFNSYSIEKNENKYFLKEIRDNIFSYHLKIKQEIQRAIDEQKIEKYHFTLFRNLLEKTANYLGYNNWGKLLIGDKITDENRSSYIRRINLFSHSNYSDIEYSELKPEEKTMLEFLFNNFKKEFKWEENK